MASPKGTKHPNKNKLKDVDDDYMRKSLQFSITLSKLPDYDHGDPAQVEKRIDEYLNTCMEYGMKTGVEGASLALGIDRMTFLRWSKGETMRQNQNVAQKLQAIIHQQYESLMVDGKMNPVAGIFLMSNNMGYEQKVTQQVEQKTVISISDDPDKLKDRYLDYNGSQNETKQLEENYPINAEFTVKEKEKTE